MNDAFVAIDTIHEFLLDTPPLLGRVLNWYLRGCW